MSFAEIGTTWQISTGTNGISVNRILFERFFSRDIREEDCFANIKYCKCVCYIHSIHKLGVTQVSLSNIKRRDSVFGKGLAKLKHREWKTVYSLLYSNVFFMSRVNGEVIMDDTTGLFVFGGTESTSGFRGYIGQATYYRNKAVEHTKVTILFILIFKSIYCSCDLLITRLLRLVGRLSARKPV